MRRSQGQGDVGKCLLIPIVPVHRRRLTEFNPPSAMSCLSWNCRGLGNPRAVHALQRLISSQDPTVVFLCETKSNSRHMEHLRFKLNFDYCFSVDSRGSSGGLCVLWKDEIKLCLRSYSQNHIDFDVGNSTDVCSWRFTAFYGFPSISDQT